MGGFETKLIASAHPGKFAYIGLFSGGTYSLEDVNEIPGFKEKTKLLFVSFGSRELEPGRRTAPPGIPPSDPRANAEALKGAGFNSVFYVSPNTRARIPVLAACLARIRAIAVPGLRRSLLPLSAASARRR